MIDFDMEDSFPLFTGRQIFTQGVIGELAAFLRGVTSVADFKKLGCNYWDRFAKDDEGDLGPIYGYQWRYWHCEGVNDGPDQLQTLVETMKTDPSSRRMLVSCWNVSDLEYMSLPPCHYAFQVNISGGKFDLLVSMRSLDLMLGFPSDVFFYAVLMKLLRNATGLQPRRLIFSIGSCHIYKVHEDQAFEYLARPIIAPPSGVIVSGSLENFTPGNVTLMGYKHGAKMDLELLV